MTRNRQQKAAHAQRKAANIRKHGDGKRVVDRGWMSDKDRRRDDLRNKYDALSMAPMAAMAALMGERFTAPGNRIVISTTPDFDVNGSIVETPDVRVIRRGRS